MRAAICLAAARTVMYPHGGGHLWVYLQWALSLLALGWRVIWLEGLNPRDPKYETLELISVLKERLKPFGLANSVALCSLTDEPLPPDVVGDAMDLDAASEADLLLNTWHSLPALVVNRFRRAAFVDTDPGLLQVWMTRGDVRVAPHHLYFTIGETVGTPAARFPDCGLHWLYTPPPVYLPAWPTVSAGPAASYTTVTHWWGSRSEFEGQIINEEKHVSFGEYKDLPSLTPARLELAICLGEHYDEWRGRMEPLGWKVRQAWDVSSTPEQYQAYIQRSRGEFSCAKPACMTLANAWVSDRTLCYLASGKPAIVQHTGYSSILPDGAGLFRFRNLDEAVKAFSAVESDYERHARLARQFTEDYFNGCDVVGRVLEKALDIGPHLPARAGGGARVIGVRP